MDHDDHRAGGDGNSAGGAGSSAGGAGTNAEPDHSRLGLQLRLAHQHWSTAIGAALDEAGFGDIRPSHANVFTFVPPGGIRVSELTQLAHVRKQTMAQAVEELERLGYAERRPDPGDRRARLVFLTERGRAVRPVTMTAGDRVAARWAELAGPAEIAALQRQLQHLLTRLEDGTPGA
ncbi:MAG: MarR family winged helix-turn-helix transcriptional regulator [Actinomycetota bacterium]